MPPRAAPTSAPAPIAESPVKAAAPAAPDICRGIMRLFARNDVWCLTEMPLRNARRADLIGIDGKGRLVIVEVKVSRADLLGDDKWQDYLDHCDRFYWGIGPDIDRSLLDRDTFLPERCGVIVADAYDAEIVRPGATHPLAAARRKVEVERMARHAMRRLTCGADEDCARFLAGGGPTI
jgi:hypothetical protein